LAEKMISQLFWESFLYLNIKIFLFVHYEMIHCKIVIQSY
jgi:hypothetical protein